MREIGCDASTRNNPSNSTINIAFRVQSHPVYLVLGICSLIAAGSGRRTIRHRPNTSGRRSCDCLLLLTIITIFTRDLAVSLRWSQLLQSSAIDTNFLPLGGHTRDTE